MYPSMRPQWFKISGHKIRCLYEPMRRGLNELQWLLNASNAKVWSFSSEINSHTKIFILQVLARHSEPVDKLDGKRPANLIHAAYCWIIVHPSFREYSNDCGSVVFCNNLLNRKWCELRHASTLLNLGKTVCWSVCSHPISFLVERVMIL